MAGNSTIRIGGDGPVVALTNCMGWQLIVRGEIRATGVDPAALHAALRALALSDRKLASDALGVVMNCGGSWEDEYTEEHGEDALSLQEWLERVASDGTTIVDLEGNLITNVRGHQEAG